MTHILARHREVGIRIGNHFVDIARETMIRILSRTVLDLCKKLGDAKAKTAFAKYGIDLVEADEE